MILYRINVIEKNKVTSSGIIKYVKSLTITITKKLTISNAIPRLLENPKMKKHIENNNPLINSIIG